MPAGTLEILDTSTLSLNLSADRLQPLVKEAPIVIPAKVFHAESAWPGRKPLGGAEVRRMMAAPACMEDSFILTTGGTELAVEVQCAVRDALVGIAPHSQCSLPPLDIASKFIQSLKA